MATRPTAPAAHRQETDAPSETDDRATNLAFNAFVALLALALLAVAWTFMHI